MKQIIKHIGEFFLPQGIKKYPGRILVNSEESKIELEIFGNESIDGQKMSDENFQKIDVNHYHQIILCKFGFGALATLHDCRLLQVQSVGKDFFLFTYQINTVFRNVLINDFSKFSFNSITIRTAHLSTWYDGWDSFDKLEEYAGVDIETVESLSINENLTLDFIDTVRKTPISIGKKYEVKYQKFIRFSYINPQHFDDIITDINKFTNLLRFSLLKKVQFKLIEAVIEDKFVEETNDEKKVDQHKIWFHNFSYLEKQDVFVDSMHQNWMLISGWKFQREELNQIIKQWFTNSDLYHIYDFYLDSHNWFEGTEAILSNVMFNNRCLNLIQALEDYHKKKSSLTPDMNEFNLKKKSVLSLLNNNTELKKWVNNRINYNKVPYLNERLTHVIVQSKTIIDGLFGSGSDIYSEFPALAKKYRDILAHGNMGGTYLGIELEYLFHQARLLLNITILKSLNIVDETIIKMFSRNENCRRAVETIESFKKLM